MIFWINVPLGFAAFLMTNAPLKRLPRHERPHRLDILGAVLLVASTSTLLVALSWAGTRFGWAAPETVGIIAASAVLFAGFFYRLRHTDDPLIPLEILANKVVRTATLAATLSVGLFLGLAVYTPILFETVRGLSASQSGLALLPLMVGTVGGTIMAGRAMARLEHYKRVPLAAMPCAALAALALMAGAGSLPVWALSLLLSVVSIALGTLLPISTVSIQNAVALYQLGTATATANLCRQLGGAVMVAMFGTIVLGNGAEGVSHAVQGDPALITAFRIVFALVAVGAIAAFVTMILMEERPLAGPSRSKTEPLALVD